MQLQSCPGSSTGDLEKAEIATVDTNPPIDARHPPDPQRSGGQARGRDRRVFRAPPRHSPPLPPGMRRLTSAEAAIFLGVSMRVLAELRAMRQIPYFKHGHRTVSYDPADLEIYLTSRRIPAIGERTGRSPTWEGKRLL